ncbi:HK97 gp10 family phage protein [Paenibacillus sp. 7124]|uniref:HK97 gp10 family phage protein n=1 Tax=Paenibacillus apii TaxID=1850370 RepID=A0A6M1PDD3_9BACL|nr:HK97 gp10 family phage protein [Paenibacillus apii]NGM81290.1 HK97 gp10 family phage protein [Paenibacillus apii]
MARDGFDTRKLDAFARQLLEIAEETMPRETKKFLRQEGLKLTRLVRNNAKSSGIEKESGNYFCSIKRGKIYKFDGNLSIRAYSNDPKAHLLEHGHRNVGKDGSEHGFTKGYKVFKRSQQEFERQYLDDCEEFINDLLKKGLS